GTRKNRGRLTVFWNAGPLSDQVGWFFDAGLGVVENVAVPKDARKKGGDCDEWGFSGADHADVVRHRHFRHFKLAELQHPPEDFGRLRRHIGEFDAVGTDGSVTQGLRSIVGATGQREL